MYLAEYPYGRLISLAFGTLEGIAKHAARTERENADRSGGAGAEWGDKEGFPFLRKGGSSLLKCVSWGSSEAGENAR